MTDRFPVTQEQLARYQEDGFLVIEQLFDQEEMNLLRDIARSDQQLAAVIDLLAGTKSTQMLLLRDKEDVGWGSDKGGQGEKGRGNIQNAADNDQVDYPGEGDLDGLTVLTNGHGNEDRALGGAEGDEEGREDAGRAPRDETSGVEEVRPSSPGGGLPLLAG